MATIPASSSLAIGNAAPDIELPNTVDAVERLGAFWEGSENGLVLVFLRHFGCVFCREHVKQLKTDFGEFERRGYDILAIGHGTPKRAAAFASELALPFPVLGDWEQVAYRAYGLGRAGWADMVSPRLYVSAARATIAGNRSGKPDGDVRQLPGTFIVDPAGVILFAKVAEIASDIATTKELLAWIDQH